MVSEGGFAFRAIPGGSVLNASVSLGRMGIDVTLLSEIGADKAGDLIAEFLENNAVHADLCTRLPGYKTSLALAFLDGEKKASYSFYHDSPVELAGAKVPVFQKEDVLLFGSFYSVKPDRRAFVLKVLQNAMEAGSVIYYDLNIRKAHSVEMSMLLPSFINNMSVATIVKGSDEDFLELFGLSDPLAIYEKVSRYCKILLITYGSGPVQVFTHGFSKSYDVPAIVPVSTIGAGDNFNAGFIYGLAAIDAAGGELADLPVAEMDLLAGYGIAFAAETCQREENFVDTRFNSDFHKPQI